MNANAVKVTNANLYDLEESKKAANAPAESHQVHGVQEVVPVETVFQVATVFQVLTVSQVLMVSTVGQV